MSKTKKSKLLASMLCATVVAGLYAGPVMAGSVDSITGDSSGIHIDIGHEKDGSTSINGGEVNGSDGLYVTDAWGNGWLDGGFKIAGKLTISSDEMVKALEGQKFQELTIGGQTFNAGFATEYAGLKDKVDRLSASNDNVAGIKRTVTEEPYGYDGAKKVTKTTSIEEDALEVTRVEKYDKEGHLIEDSWSPKNTITANGKMIINDSLEVQRGITAAGGKFTVSGSNGEVTAPYLTATHGIKAAGDKFTVNGVNGNVTTVGSITAKDVVANGTSLINVGAGLDKATNDIAILRTDTNTLRTDVNTVDTIARNNEKNINTITGDVATLRTDTNTLRTDVTNLDGKVNVIGNKTTDISYDKGVTTIAETAKFGKGYMQVGSTILAKDGSIGAANGKFTVTPDGEVIVSGENGSTNINGNGITVGDTVITNGVITTHKADIGGVEIANGRVDGVDVSELSGSVFDNSKDITELERKTTGIDYANGVTTVGGVTSFDANGMKTSNIEAASGTIGGVAMSDGGIITDRNALSVVGGVSMVGGRLQAEQGTIGGVAIKDGHVDGVDVSQLRDIVGGNVTEVGDLRQKTQEISYDEATRTTTVSGVDFANGTITAGNGNFTVSENGVVTASAVNTNIVMFEGGSIMSTGIRAIDGKFIVDAEGNVKAAGDVTSTNYSLEAVGEQVKNVEGITRVDGVTDIEGVAQFGNGSVKVNGTMQVAGDKFVYSYQDEDGNMRVGSLKTIDSSIDALEDKTTDIKYADGVTEIGKGVLAVNNEGYVTINNGMLTVDAESGYVTMGNKIELDTASGNITANNVYSKNYNLETIGDQLNELETGVGTDISDLKRKTTDIEYADGVTTIAGANKFTENGMQVGTTVINKDGSIGAGNGNFTVTADGEVIVRGENGATSITGDAITIGDTVITNGVITTEKAVIGGVDISNGRVDGVDVSELAGSVFDGSKDIAELQRITTGMDYQNGVTSFSGDITFRHNGDTVSLGGLVDKVNDIYDRTSGISKDENGNTVIDGGLVVDGDTTGTGGSITGNGDMNISGDGQIGGDLDVAGSVNAGNVNTGNINAGKGTIGGIHMENGEMTVGDTTVNGDGITVGGIVKDDEGKESGSKVTIDKGDVSVDWVDEDGNKQHASIKDNAEAIEGIYEDMGAMSNRISKVEDRIDKVGAMSAAIANLRTMGYDPTAPTEIAVGIGQYRSETGAALGLFHYPNRDFMLSLSVSTSGDEVMGGIGATWKFGRKSPEQMLAAEKEKAAKAKLAKAEAMKKAAAEAKVAQQQAKHAKMAAEKAAK